MPATHDGMLVDLKRDNLGLAIALLALVATAVAGARWIGWCAAAPVMGVCALVAIDRLKGERRVRVTTTKLLIEDNRPVRGFLIGPVRTRMAWTDLDRTEIDGDGLRLHGRDGTVLDVVRGCPRPEIQELVEKIETAKRRAAERAAEP